MEDIFQDELPFDINAPIVEIPLRIMESGL